MNGGVNVTAELLLWVKLGRADHLPGSRMRGRCSPVSGPISVQSDRGSLGPDSDILASARRRNLHATSHECSIRLMEEQFIPFPVRAEMELHPEALKLVDDEGSALVGTEFVGGLVPNCQREVSIVVLPDNNSRDSLAERA